MVMNSHQTTLVYRYGNPWWFVGNHFMFDSALRNGLLASVNAPIGDTGGVLTSEHVVTWLVKGLQKDDHRIER